MEFTLNGKIAKAQSGETILDVAKREGLDIPHLCFKEGLACAGNCRACVVEIEGERTLAPSCCREVQQGMVVHTDNERVGKAQRMVLELLNANMPEQAHRPDSELDHYSQVIGVQGSRFERRKQPSTDASHPAITVNMDACIQCTRCVRACREEQGNAVIGLAWRGDHAQIVFDMSDPLAESTCVACGECVQACPTGALMSTSWVQAGVPQQTHAVDSLCPFCGVGCQVTYHVKEDRIVRVEGRDGPANDSRLCVKGRYGFDYVHHPERLTQPLIRREDAPKVPHRDWTAESAMAQFRPATWDEVLNKIGEQFKGILAKHGNQSLAGFGSAKCSNEEAYLFQKLVRTGFGNHHVDHCTRLCHASSVSALLEGLGSGAVSNPVKDALEAEVIVVIGANPTVNHPVGATWMKNAVSAGSKLIVMDPRKSDLTRIATHHIQFKPDTDVALLNAMLHVIVQENLVDHEFVARRTEGYDAFIKNLTPFTPEAMAPICGIDADTIRQIARMYATSKGSIIFWGMGVSQHIHGTDNARCLIALALLTGQIGRPGTGLHPLRGQNNVQGASDAGLIPMMFPDYQKVTDAKAKAFFEDYWNCELSDKPGLTVVEIMKAITDGQIRGMYIMGENPAMSDPDAQHAREALTSLDFLLVQDIFMTETAALADIVLPASAFAEKTGSFTNTDRTVQMARAALPLPGDARQDLWIVQQVAKAIGLNWQEQTVAEVFDEMRLCMPEIRGITWERLEKEDAVTYPCKFEGDTGHPVVFTETFPTPSGKGKLVPASLVRADELPDEEYPVVLMTGRQLEHWHTGSMTRRSNVLDALEPVPVVQVHPDDLAKMGVKAGDVVELESRRGAIQAFARQDAAVQPGTVFMAFCYAEGAINKLTNPALDPFGKIPELKFCAVRISVPKTETLLSP